MAAPDGLYQLVERFEGNRDAYRSGRYNETQARVEFINPLFELLGWDIDNRSGALEAYKDVVHEDAIKVGGAHKAPDYGFRVGGARKFFVEAKKPSVNLREDVDPSFQLRRYAWSARLPVSILTDFEEFAVYDCRVTPDKNDSPATARLQFHSFDQYPDKWDEIAGVFSKEAVLGGSLDVYAEKAKTRRGTETVDAVFLKEIESWRETLARDLALRNSALTIRELNYAVQVTIDRIIFLRMTEDRGIEDYGRLQALLNGEHVYARLRDLYRQADERYNSGLFHFQPEKGRTDTQDTLTPKLEFGDTALRSIIKGLYYPDSPYEFSVLPIEVLGQVYEQFLGKVIDLSPNRAVKIEEKPEVRKAGGVYYTPKYIVDYIVEQTVGKLVEGKKPGARGGVSKLRIVDPACGSGSFLIGAYEYLLDWHRDQYIADGTEKHTKEIYQGRGGEWHLSTGEKKRILLNNIYGVDIDPQAVEVTKLSLLLKVLEGESSESLVTQLSMFRERALPDLSNNIKCGNSLIGPDFYDTGQMTFLDPEEHYRVNVFDWNEAFPEVFSGSDPGFDAIVGNPPYIRIQRIAHDQADYFFRRYETPASKTDLSQLFLERALSLTSSSGLIGFISTSQWLATDYGKNMRLMLAGGLLHQVVDFGSLPVFENVSTYPAVFILSPSPGSAVKYVSITAREQLSLQGICAADERYISLSNLGEAPWNFGAIDIPMLLKAGTRTWFPLKHFGNAYIGALTGMDAVFVVDNEKAKALGLEDAILFPYAYRGAEVVRYGIVKPRARVIYPYREGAEGSPALRPESELKESFPSAYHYLAEHKASLQTRKDSRKLYAIGEDWYRFLRPGSFNYIRPKKYLVKGIDNRATIGILAGDTVFNGANCPGIILNENGGHSSHYFLGLLNSSITSCHLLSVCPSKLGGYTRFNARNISNTPIPQIDFEEPRDVQRHDAIVEYVDQMIEVQARIATLSTPQERSVVERQAAAIDRRINQVVYELYGLTDEEIAVVEEATS